MLIGQVEAETGESEAACADRWRVTYGLTRAGHLAQILAKFSMGPWRAYYRTVGILLTQFTVGRKNQVLEFPRDPVRQTRTPGLTRRRLTPEEKAIKERLVYERKIRAQDRAWRKAQKEATEAAQKKRRNVQSVAPYRRPSKAVSKK